MDHEPPASPWVCSCRLCRALVHPLLTLNRVEEGGDNRKGGEDRVSEENGKGPGGEDAKELKELVSALRDSIMELKAALSDLNNPFLEEAKPASGPTGTQKPAEPGGAGSTPNSAASAKATVGEHGESTKEPVAPKVVKLPSTGESEAGEEEHMLYPLSASGRIAPSASPTEIRARQHEGLGPGGSGADLMGLMEGTVERRGREQASKGVHQRVSAADLKKTLRMLRLMYRLARRLPGESLEHYIELLRNLGLVDERTARTVEILKKLVEVSRREGISPEDHIIALYSLAKMLGVQDRELEEEIAMVMVERLRSRQDTGPGVGEGVEDDEGDDKADEGGGSQWGLPLQ